MASEIHRGSGPWTTLALALFAGFVVALVALHGLRPDYTPIDHMISDYAVGRYGWLMTAAFVAVGAGCFSLTVGLWRDGPKTALSLIGRVLILVASAGLMVTAAFPTDLETAPSTQHGDIHAISFLVNIVSLFIAALTLSVSFGADARWKSLRPLALAITAALIAAFVAQAMTLHKGLPYGITNRIFVAVLMSWLFAAALRLRAVARG